MRESIIIIIIIINIIIIIIIINIIFIIIIFFLLVLSSYCITQRSFPQREGGRSAEWPPTPFQRTHTTPGTIPFGMR